MQTEREVINGDFITSLTAAFGHIQASLSTLLINDGHLCEGSQVNELVAYCRFVSQLMTFSTQGEIAIRLLSRRIRIL